jgi:hypothetical protein
LEGSPRENQERLPVAAIVTAYTPNSHADVIIGKILEGFNHDGRIGPALRLAALYAEQVPPTDLSRELATKHNFRLANSIEEAITLGQSKVSVAGVISIGVFGDYPYTKDTHQHMYPRRRFFDSIAEVFRKHNRVVPVFNDKHLAHSWQDAKHMVDTARTMSIPLLAGSSVPVAWRTPELELPQGCNLTGALAVGYGGLESYGFHALEGLQCMVERRHGGETGVARVQAVTGDAIATALRDQYWSQTLLDSAVAAVPSPTRGRPESIDQKSVFYLIEYRDGLRAAVAMGTGLAHQFAFAGQVKGAAKPVATWFHLDHSSKSGHFGHLLKAFEYTVHSGKPAYPVQRTLLTTGILDALMHSIAEGYRVVETPELAIHYQPVDWPFAPGLPPD